MKRPEVKLCPTCWNDMRPTPEGYVCPRHGLVALRAERATQPRKPPPQVKPQVKPRVPKRARTPSVSRPPRVIRPREPNQTDRLTRMCADLMARNHAGESIAALAADVWEELGYKSAHVCASKMSRFLSRQGLTVAPSRSGPPPGIVPGERFTQERLDALREALADGSSVWAFAETHWQAWGFRSRSSCDSLLRKWLHTKVPHV